MISGYLQDLRAALRMLLNRPALSITAILTLALGLAVNLTVFGWIDNVLLQPVPGAAEPESLVSLERLSSRGETIASPHPDLRDYQRGCSALSGLAGSHLMPFTVGADRSAQHVYGQFVSANFFHVLGVRPALGRTFTPAEDRDVEGAYPYAVISDRLWREQFHANPAVAGAAERINGQLVTVIGVAPPSFRGSFNGFALDLWVHLSMIHLMGGAGSWQAADRNAQPLTLIGRLRPGATLEQAQSQAETIARRLAAEYPATHDGSGAIVLPLWKSHAGVQGALLSPLAALMGASLLLLFVACANVANLLLARALSRQAEFGLRLAMGARVTRLLAQMFMEGALLAIAATAAGLLLAMWMGEAVAWLQPPMEVPLSSFLNVTTNARTVLFALVLCALVACLSSIPPALRVLRSDVAGSLRESGRSATSSRAASLTRRWLVIGEVALSTIAVIGAGLFVRSFQKASGARLGFEPGGVIAARLYLSSAGYPATEEVRFCRTLAQRLKDFPGVESVSYGIELPLIGGGTESLEVEGYTPRLGESMIISRNNVGPDYFRLLRIPLVQGREFTDRDEASAPDVVIINRSFASRYLPGQDPLGHRLRISLAKSWSTVIGVVQDTRQGNPLDPPRPAYYAPFQQQFASGHDNYFLIRAAGRPADALDALRVAVKGITPASGVYQAQLLNAHLQGALFVRLVTASLMSALGIMSLLLAGIGLYGITAYSVSDRRQEIAVRMALGARPGQVWRMVFWESLGTLAWGLLLGFAATLAAARAVASMLAGIGPADPVAFGAAGLFLCLVGLLAGALPARRATQVEPIHALRCQ